jgi:hypothetical protein
MSKKVDFSQIQLTQTHQNYAKASSLLILDVAKKRNDLSQVSVNTNLPEL